MRLKNATQFFIFVLLGTILNAQIFISPDGDDSTGTGTIDLPLKTLTAAIKLASADSTIYLRGGVYDIDSKIGLSKNGTSGHMINIFAYEDETPVLDFSSMASDNTDRGIQLSGNYIYIKGLTIRYAHDNAIHISGGNNIVEKCVFYANWDTGLQIGNNGHDNQVINCDSYRNCDVATKGENADGFAAKLDVGDGNIFKGCRAWENADDGWDLFEAKYKVTIENCWTFNNGRNFWGIVGYQGDGNGFKLGGNYVAARHMITKSFAFDNPGKGFDQNHNTDGLIVYSCTAYRNGTNFALNEEPTTTNKHILKNNLSYSGQNSIVTSAQQSTNSWQGFSVSEADFRSLDSSEVKLPRKADGSLPDINFMNLASTSPLIDAGVKTGLFYLGSSPDIGAFEFDGVVDVANNDNKLPENYQLSQNYPNPFNPATIINYTIPNNSNVKLEIFNLLGQSVITLVDKYQSAGEYSVKFSAEKLNSGIYLYRLSSGNFTQTRKMILVK